MFIENRIKILKSRNEQILEDKINEISNNQNDLVFPKEGNENYNFTARWKTIQCKRKDKTFYCNMDPDKNLFMKLKQFKRTA